MAEADDGKSQEDKTDKSQEDDKGQDDEKSDKSQEDGDKSQAGESISKEEAKKLKSEAQSLRKRLHQLEEEQKKADNEKLSETERLKKEKSDLEKSLNETKAQLVEHNRREAFLTVASDEKRQVKNPRALYRFVRDDIETDDDGQITNLESLFKQAKQEAPELFGAKANGSADGGSGSREGSKGGDMNSLIRQATGRT